MKRVLGLIALIAAVVCPSPARADVTMTMTMSTTGPMSMEGTQVVYIKGSKMRTDLKLMGQDSSILIDVATRQQLLINHATRQVQTFDPSAAMAAMPFEIGAIAVSVKPTGETKELLGRTCSAFAVQITIPMTVNGETITMTLSGPAWIAKSGPGIAEYESFYKAAVEAGIVTSPLGQGPQAKALAEMQKAFTDNGIPFEQELRFGIDGSGQLAQMMASQLGEMTMTNRLAALSTDPIPDDRFTVPEGYTKK